MKIPLTTGAFRFFPHACLRSSISLVLVALSFFYLSNLYAQKAKASEYEVKATYLYSFSRFVQWPPNATAAQGNSFSICVIGKDPFGAVLDGILAGEIIDGKAVVAKRVTKPQDAVGCRVLYISLSEDSRLKELLAALDKAGVLTVSDIPQFSQRGGMIQFVAEGSRVRFEINLASAEAAKLLVSAELLKVAATVRKNGQPGD